MPDRKDGVYLLPACAQLKPVAQPLRRIVRSNGASVSSPLFESQTDHAIMYAFAKKFGFAEQFAKNTKIVKAGRRPQVGRARSKISFARSIG